MGKKTGTNIWNIVGRSNRSAAYKIELENFKKDKQKAEKLLKNANSVSTPDVEKHMMIKNIDEIQKKIDDREIKIRFEAGQLPKEKKDEGKDEKNDEEKKDKDEE